jgi:hypothetical protein
LCPYTLAAIVLMPVPSVCVQYALDHDMDAKLAGALANYSQVGPGHSTNFHDK